MNGLVNKNTLEYAPNVNRLIGIGRGEKMPEIGEIRKAAELGYKGKDKYQWIACAGCGNERWVSIYRLNQVGYSGLCFRCRLKSYTKYSANSLKPSWEGGEKNPNWKGGRICCLDGYIKVFVTPGDFFYPMTQASKRRWGAYILEHRLVMAKHLKRCLLPWEVVHHKNGVRDDNRIENLQLLPDGKYHLSDNFLKAQLKRLVRRMNKLEQENRELKRLLAEVT